jgi:hypothetical protein
MARHLFIVSRHHAGLYTYLTERFQDDRKVDIIIDRRVEERRRGEWRRASSDGLVIVARSAPETTSWCARTSS